MKKRIIIAVRAGLKPAPYCLLLLALLFAACQDEREFLGGETTPGEVVTISLSPVFPANAGIKPLSSGDGGATELDEDDYDLRYILEVYDGATMVGTRKVEIADDYTTPVNFSVELPAKPYTFVFWADFVNKGQTDDLTYKTDNAGGLTDIEWQASAYAIGDNLRDAYYATETIDLTAAPATESITLHRPLGKLRILATDVKEYLDDNPGVSLGKAELTYTAPTTFRKGFNALTGAPGTGTIAVAAATCTPKLEASVTVAGQTFSDVYVLAFDYFFVPAGLDEVSFEIELFDDQDATLASKTVSAPVGVNKLTTVLGNVFNPGATMDANIADSFGDPESTLISGSPVPIPHWLDNTLTFDNTTFLSAATLTWTNESVDSYEVEVNGGTTYSVPDNSKALDNLPEATTYQWKVRAVKDGKTSEWSYTKTFQTPVVPFIDKMVGNWGASDAVVNGQFGASTMTSDELMNRSHTTSPVTVTVTKNDGSPQVTLTGMTAALEGGTTSLVTPFNIDVTDLPLAVDEESGTVSAVKTFGSGNVYERAVNMTVSTANSLFNLGMDSYLFLVGSSKFENLTMRVNSITVTGTLNAAGQATWSFVYDVTVTKITHDISSTILNAASIDGDNLHQLLPTPQYMLSEVEMAK